MKRRSFLAAPAALAQTFIPIAPSPDTATRQWIGESYFANRYQDWRLHNGRIECLANGAGEEVRSLAILTRSIEQAPAQLRVTLGVIEDAGGGGFAGFLIGAGGGQLDWRAAALVGRASGEGGGLLCVCDASGRAHIRDHSSESDPFAYAELPGKATTGTGRRSGKFDLQVDIEPHSEDAVQIRVSTFETGTDILVSAFHADNVPLSLVRGGISLVSSPTRNKRGARFWFLNPRTSGAAIHPERTFGPILATTFSVNGPVLKLTAHMAPVGASDPQAATLEIRTGGGAWRKRAEVRLEPGFIAAFRVDKWNSSRDHEYRVRYGTASYTGRIPRDPGSVKPLKIGFVNCVMTAWRTMDSPAFHATIPGEAMLGRYTKASVYFPHTELITGMQSQQPDLLAFLGDQIYEGNPTRKDQSDNPELDYLYKWHFWVWAFRDLTRNIPCVVMVDDHDVFQGNVWGQGGRLAPDRIQEAGGYTTSGRFVNLVQRTQASHNPDPFDPTPVQEGIGVYYCAFRYGGVEFAMVEDRKFKSGPQSPDQAEPQLLGPRQEAFLAEWAVKVKKSAAKIVFTQTVFACVQTSPEGAPRKDTDSNGAPKPKRDLALRLVKNAGALMICGDQHLASVVRHGIDSISDGPLQFCGPGGGTSFQRWFEPPAGVPTAFTDGYGNRFRVLAVANPKVSFATYRKHKPPRGQGLGDRNLKSEGYGVVIVDHRARQYELQCWIWNEPRQFPGWPIAVRFDEA
ncbi:MAG: alkaline phosphatase D family protein [Candidatus Sumerlaeaceae bacterium]|nr:alkaline phosphatase D family protein [Candidatus Sumerlaeaceae bacterium]